MRTEIPIATGGGKQVVKGYRVAAGLAVVPYYARAKEQSDPLQAIRGWWLITHIPSGKSIGGPKHFAEARQAAKRLAALGDWNRPAESVSDLGLGEVAVLAALGEVRREP